MKIAAGNALLACIDRLHPILIEVLDGYWHGILLLVWLHSDPTIILLLLHLALINLLLFSSNSVHNLRNVVLDFAVFDEFLVLGSTKELADVGKLIGWLLILLHANWAVVLFKFFARHVDTLLVGEGLQGLFHFFQVVDNYAVSVSNIHSQGVDVLLELPECQIVLHYGSLILLWQYVVSFFRTVLRWADFAITVLDRVHCEAQSYVTLALTIYVAHRVNSWTVLATNYLLMAIHSPEACSGSCITLHHLVVRDCVKQSCIGVGFVDA